MDTHKNKKRIAILLAGGGARAAYQVGVIKGLARITPRGCPLPFQIVCGTSAGAINAAALASYAHDFQRASTALNRIWANFRTQHVIRSDFAGISKTALRWLMAMALGGMGRRNPLFLFDRAPLKRLLNKHMPLANIQGYIDEGYLHAVGVTCSGYNSGESVSFFQGTESISGWSRTFRKGTHVRMDIEHLMASSAIPFLFEAVKVNREYFGDGSIRQTAPFSLPIHLGADAVLAIGSHPEVEPTHERAKHSEYPSLGQIVGFALDSIFLDNMQADMERLSRINHTLSLIPEDENKDLGVNLKPVDAMLISPSRDLGDFAMDHFHELPWTIRSLMRGLGVSNNAGSSNLVSYLMFEKGYCRDLIELGYQDALARQEDLAELLAIE